MGFDLVNVAPGGNTDATGAPFLVSFARKLALSLSKGGDFDLWVEAKEQLDKIKPLFWLGELDSLDNPEYMQVFDAAYTWKWMHKAEQYYKAQVSFGYCSRRYRPLDE